MKKFLTDNLHIIVIVVAVIAVYALVKVRRVESCNATKDDKKETVDPEPKGGDDEE